MLEADSTRPQGAGWAHEKRTQLTWWVKGRGVCT